MRSILIFIPLILSSCFASRPPPLPELPTIFFDSRVGKFDIVVEPVQFVATVSSDLVQNLCADANTECGGRPAAYEVPQIGNQTGYTEYLQVGPQTYPGLSASALAGDFAGVLKEYQNIETIALQPTAAQRESIARDLVIRTMVTEAAWDGEKTAGGMGSTVAGNLLMINVDPQRLVSTLGYARIDVSVVDTKTGEILAAFPASGTYRSEYLSDDVFVFASDIPQGYGAHMLRSAIRMAFQDATQRLAQRLSENAGVSR
jgi:hypothetical protein